MAATFPGGNNTFVPSFEASGKLQVELSRNPKSFAVNKYIGVKKAPKSEGKYLFITAQEASRVAAIQNYVWADGADQPTGIDGTESFEFRDFKTHRYASAFRLGNKSIEQADWEISAAHGRIHAQKMMTIRSINAATVLTTAGNWAGNTDTATNAGDGKWDVSDEDDQFILKSFQYVQRTINLATQGIAGAENLCCIVNPTVAQAMRASPEILNFIKQTPGAFEALMGTAFFQKWGLPEKLYGVTMVVDDTVKTTSNKGATLATGYTYPDTVAVFATQLTPLGGKLDEAAGQPIFDTCTAFVYEDMTVELKSDPDNRRTIGRVVDDHDIVLTCPATGYLLTAVAGS